MSIIRILYIVSNLRRCGPTNQLFYIIKYLDRQVFDPHILTLSPEPKDGSYQQFIDLGVKCSSLNLGRVSGVMLASKAVKRALSEIKPDIIHTQGIRADAISEGLKDYKFRVCTQRNYPYHDYPMKYGRVVGSLIARYHYSKLTRIPYVVACSKAISELNVRHGVTSTFVRNGIDCLDARSTMNQISKEDIRSSLGIPSDAVVFISSGALSDRKAPLDLVSAFKVCDDGNRHLIMLGDGKLRKECEALANGSKNIHFAGHVSNVCDYLAAADCFVSASRSEGLPNSVLEALNEGLPVLLSDIPPHREIVEIDPRVGALFPVGDCDALSSMMGAFRFNPAASMISMAVIENTLRAQRMSKEYQSLYLSSYVKCIGDLTGTRHESLSAL